MNKNKKTFFLIGGIVAFVAVAGFLVYGIQKGKDEVAEQPPTPETTTTLLPEELVDKKSVENQGKVLSEISGVSECSFSQDQEAFSSAIKEEEMKFCDCIENENMKDNCKKSLTDLTLYNQAINQYNPTVCNEISNEEQKEACKTVVMSGIESLKAQEGGADQLAAIYELNHDYDVAIALLEEGLQGNENQEDVSSFLSLALLNAGKGLSEQEKGGDQTPYVAKALEYTSKAIAIDPDNSEAYRVQGYVYEIQPDYSRSAENYDKAIDLSPDYVPAYVGRGHVAELQGFLEGALEDYKKAAELDTNKEFISVYSNLCRLESTRSDLYEDAIKNCEIVTNFQGKELVYYKSQAHQILATMYMRHDRFDEALTQLQVAKSYTPSDSNLHVTFGELYLKIAGDADDSKNLVEAEKYARKAIELTSTKAGAYAVLSYSVYKQHKEGNGKLDEALQIAEKGLSLVDDDVSLISAGKQSTKNRFYWTMANIYNFKGDKENENKYLNLIKDDKNSTSNLEE